MIKKAFAKPLRQKFSEQNERVQKSPTGKPLVVCCNSEDEEEMTKYYENRGTFIKVKLKMIG